MAFDIFDRTFDPAKEKNQKNRLKEDMVMGFSVAFCDNDGNGRENFIGSVPNALDSWMNATLFGKITLIAK